MGGSKSWDFFGTTGRGCFRSDTVFVDCYLGFWTNNCVLLPLYLWYWGLINGSSIDGIKNSIWTEWKCIFYVIINGWPIDMSSHPTPRVGCAIVGLAILVHDSRQVSWIRREPATWVRRAPARCVAPKNWRDFLENLKYKIWVILSLCPLITVGSDLAWECDWTCRPNGRGLINGSPIDNYIKNTLSLHSNGVFFFPLWEKWN